jgi:predicted Zn finger-like uncharacterized protein
MPEQNPLARIQPVLGAACPKCNTTLSDNGLQLALQGKSVRCQKCRNDVKLSADTIARIKQSRKR